MPSPTQKTTVGLWVLQGLLMLVSNLLLLVLALVLSLVEDVFSI